jgi:hypothetical protein
MSFAPSNSRTTVLCNPFLSNGTVNTSTIIGVFREVCAECLLSPASLKPPCGGRVKQLHCDPASHRRQRKGKSQIWDSKIWSRVPWDLDLRKTALAKASSIYKRQTRPLVIEGVTQKQDRNWQRVINIWSWAPDLMTDWPSVAMLLWQSRTCDFWHESPIFLILWHQILLCIYNKILMLLSTLYTANVKYTVSTKQPPSFGHTLKKKKHS